MCTVVQSILNNIFKCYTYCILGKGKIKMKKILTLVLCLVMLFGVSGCSGDSKDTIKEVIEGNETIEEKDNIEKNDIPETNDETGKMSTIEKQKNIRDLKAAAPDPTEYLVNDEQITRETYLEGNNTYEFFIDKSVNRTDLFDKYIEACKCKGYTIDYYQILEEETGEPNNLSVYSGKLTSDDSYNVWVQYSHDDDYVWILIQHII